MRKKIFIGLAAFVALVVVAVLVFAGVVAMQPNEFRVERKATIAAPPDAVFAHVNDFHKWNAWSPWVDLDPAAKYTFEGSEEGEGAIYKWSGNDKVGEGSMTIAESKPPERIKIKLAFTRPMQDTSDVEMVLRPQGEKTEVTWSMYGQLDFMSKAFCLFMDMDKMLGGDFEKGLASLKEVAEAEQKDE